MSDIDEKVAIKGMTDFELHHKLKQDCFVLGNLQNSLLLLMNNSLVPWFVIVPKTSKLEIHELTEAEKEMLYANINLLSEFIMQNFQIDKLNVASIGNVVNQMHIHVIGRRRDDFCWPNVVWGRAERVGYEQEGVLEIVEKLKTGLKDYFISDQVKTT